MSSENNVDQTVLHQIRMRDKTVMTSIYTETYPMVLKHVSNHQGTVDDAKDILQDAFFIFIKKAEEADFLLTSKVSTYLVGISKNLWLKKSGRVKINSSIYLEENGFNDHAVEEDEQDFLLNRTKQLSLALSNLGEPCRGVLVSYYYQKKNMQEIADEYHYTNAENAKNQKYKCLQRLKKLFYPHG
ncbi:MAG: sigma-70 family RNA polymerase sigma factor [Crocinitomicaceae bacterium]|nr:sigma-70 family RNA polymerase sigma factor [Crocinitomicaceae bacterium]MBK8926719.1 sigma-70 family RNA polymerase sigma factor [Crocinitomicaceae bacterium]